MTTNERANHMLTVRDYLIEREVDGHGRKAYSAVLWNTTLEVLREDGSGHPVPVWTPGGTRKRLAPRWALDRAWGWIKHRMLEKAAQNNFEKQNPLDSELSKNEVPAKTSQNGSQIEDTL